MQQTREDEARYFDAFREARPDLPLGEFKHGDKPDFLGLLGSTKIGIEVTRYSPEKQAGLPFPDEQESLQQRTLSSARDAYEADGGRPVNMHAIFRQYPALTKKRVHALSAEIAHVVRGSRGPLYEYRRSGLDDLIGTVFLPEIASLRATWVPTREHAHWYAGSRGWPYHAQERDIGRIVNRKEKRVQTYRGTCDEIWLLMAFDSSAAEFEVRPPVEPVDFRIATSFDRIFCLSPATLRCVEVPVTRP
jgi:hypothetical protein